MSEYELKRQGITIPFPIRTLHVERKKAPPLQEDQAEAFSILRGERLFDCLSEDQLNHMVNQARLKLFGRGEPVIEEGAAGESMFVMLRGAANVFVSKNGSKIQVATLGAGDCFGEMSLLTGEPRSATVRADGDCYVMEIGKPVMAEVLSGAPTLHGAIESIACPAKNGNRRDPERSYKHGRACINRTPIHGQLPAPAPDVFPTLTSRFGQTI